MRTPGEVGQPFGDTSTARLSLRRPAAADAADLFAVYSDPRVWRDDPWVAHGLGPWVLRNLTGPTAGELVGSGGCSLWTAGTTTVWNLAFVLRAEMWGQGFAQEVAAAGRHCARALHPELPVTAVVAAGNPRSRRAVERAGLSTAWRGPDPKDPDPAAELVLYTDRALERDQVRALTG